MVGFICAGKMTCAMMGLQDGDTIENVLIRDAAQFMKYAKEANFAGLPEISSGWPGSWRVR